MHPLAPNLHLVGDPARNLFANTLRALSAEAVRILELNDVDAGDWSTAGATPGADDSIGGAELLDALDVAPVTAQSAESAVAGAAPAARGAGLRRLRRAAQMFAALADEVRRTDGAPGEVARGARGQLTPFLAAIRRDAMDPAETAFWFDVARVERDLHYLEVFEADGVAGLNALLAESLAQLRSSSIDAAQSKVVAARLNDLLRRAIYLFPHVVDTIEVDLACSSVVFERDVEHFMGRDRANRFELHELWQIAGSERPPVRRGDVPVSIRPDVPDAATIQAQSPEAVEAVPAPEAASAVPEADVIPTGDGVERMRIRLPLPYVFTADTEQGRWRARRESWEDLVFVPHRRIQRQDVKVNTGANAAKFTVVLAPLLLIRTAFDGELGLSRATTVLAREVTRVGFTRGGRYLPARSAKLADRPHGSRPDPLTHYLLFRDFGDIGNNPRLAETLRIDQLANHSLFEPAFATGLCDVFDDDEGRQWLEHGFGYLALLGRGHAEPMLLRFDGVAIEYRADDIRTAKHSPLQQYLYRAALDPAHPIREKVATFTADGIIRELMQVPVAPRRFR